MVARTARTYGIGLAGVRRGTHYGMGAIYVPQAIEAGMISLAFTDSSPAIPVWGGRNVFLGAAPFAAGAPGGKKGPYVLDMAMTVVARGKIRLAAQRGDPIPPGLALDLERAPDDLLHCLAELFSVHGAPIASDRTMARSSPPR